MNPETASPRQEDQFRELLGVLRRRKGIVAVTVALFLGLGVVSILITSPSYQVTEQVLIQNYFDGPTSQSNDPIARVSQMAAAPEIGAQIGLMQGPDVLKAAFESARVQTPSLETLSGRTVDIQQENNGPVLTIRINLPDAESATRLAVALPEAYNNYITSSNAANTTAATNSLKLKVDTARKELATAQKNLEDELAGQGTAQQGGTVAANGAEGQQRTIRLNNFEQQLETARVTLASAQSQLQESIVAQSKVPKEIEDTNIRPSVERIAMQERVVADLNAQLQTLLSTNTEKSPDVKALRARIREENAYLQRLPRKTNSSGTVRNPERAGYDQRVADAKIRVEASRVEIAKLEEIVAKERAGLDNYQKRLPRQRQLETLVAEKQAALESANQGLNSITGLVGKGRQPVQLLATSEPVKTQPVIGRTLVASTLLGFIFGIFAALIRDRFDNRIYTLEQIYDVSGAVPIGQVPTSTKALGPNVGAQNRSRVLESYRSLRFNLETSAEGEAAQSVLVSSGSAGEGRAGLSMNLATEAATDMRRTILVDADMRTPELHDLLKLARGPGLSDVLSGQTDLESVLVPTSQPNLMFLPAGSATENPLELLTGAAFAAVHEALKERAEVIVFNSPSLMRYTDARAIAKVADSVLFVAKRGFTRRDTMRYCLGMLRRAKARILGVVLSDEAGRTKDVPYFAAE